ncbi:unnamed protein product [Protopolystoma xenopodis]|uniref:Uncharacterized protein n=1 Tax=Protopolystoma xenopodis TaxID=117903 RepID=A0A3S5FCB1_9PLAT|nr:unnamed protein product [Protopolystoma xenopodis]
MEDRSTSKDIFYGRNARNTGVLRETGSKFETSMKNVKDELVGFAQTPLSGSTVQSNIITNICLQRSVGNTATSIFYFKLKSLQVQEPAQEVSLVTCTKEIIIQVATASIRLTSERNGIVVPPVFSEFGFAIEDNVVEMQVVSDYLGIRVVWNHGLCYSHFHFR